MNKYFDMAIRLWEHKQRLTHARISYLAASTSNLPKEVYVELYAICDDLNCSLRSLQDNTVQAIDSNLCVACLEKQGTVREYYGIKSACYCEECLDKVNKYVTECLRE